MTSMDREKRAEASPYKGNRKVRARRLFDFEDFFFFGGGEVFDFLDFLLG
jgi:hypothetical protein